MFIWAVNPPVVPNLEMNCKPVRSAGNPSHDLAGASRQT
jgi:hypothetical protein